MKKEQELRSISRNQYGTLRYINDEKVTMGYLRHAHATTLWSLLRWGWIATTGTSEDAQVILTRAGQEELKAYQQATLAERAKEADLTERCARLLRHSRRLAVMTRKVA